MTSSGVVPGPWKQEIERTLKELEKAGKRYLDRELDGHINAIIVLQRKLEEANAENDRLTKVIENNQGVNKQAYDNGHKAGYAKGVEVGRQYDASASNEAYAKGVEVGARAVTQRIRASWLQLADELREIDPADIL